VRERAERQALAAHLDAAARQDPGARGARALGGLLDQSCLAHAGLATEEDDRGIARDGRVERGGQRRQLGIATDEDRLTRLRRIAPILPSRRAAAQDEGDSRRSAT
jgi:hypothetical protein